MASDENISMPVKWKIIPIKNLFKKSKYGNTTELSINKIESKWSLKLWKVRVTE